MLRAYDGRPTLGADLRDHIIVKANKNIDFKFEEWSKTNQTEVFIFYSGHGLALTTMVGKMIAEVLESENNDIKLFEKFVHRDFPGFGVIDTPLLVLAMSYFKMKDLINL